MIEAASADWPEPEIGRKLYGFARRAGFEHVSIQVLTSPDTTGRLNGMIQTVIGYARENGNLEPDRIDVIEQAVERGLAEGTYLAISPQFLVTAVA